MWSVRNFIINMVNLVVGVVTLMLGLRFILTLLAANPATPIVSWIYRVSDNLIYPFQGLLPNISIGGAGSLDLVALVAMLAYSLIGYLLISLFDGVMTPVADRVHAHGDQIHSH